MKHGLLWGFAGSLLASVGCSGAPDVTEMGTTSPEPVNRGATSVENSTTNEREAVADEVETHAQMLEQLRREGDILQAALDAEYTREQQATMLAEMERQTRVDFTGLVSSEEVRTIQARFAAQGISADRVSFVGRMVRVDQSDAYYQADALLEEGASALHEAEKNYVYTGTSTTVQAYGTPQSAPDQFAKVVGANTQFWRPALAVQDFPGVTRHYQLVIDQPNPAMPTAIRTALSDAVASVEAANNNSNDCLLSGTFQILTSTEWNAQTSGNKLYHYRINVRYRPVFVTPGLETLPACGVGAYACSVFPRKVSSSYAFPPASTSAARMAFGTYIGIPSNGPLVTSGMTALNVKEFIAHELGHVIGLSHPFTDGGSHVLIPGTVSRNQDPNSPGTYQSFMDYDFVDALNAWPISNDDKLAMRKLYPANGCGYTNGFQNIL
jgi:hypothetical protein